MSNTLVIRDEVVQSCINNGRASYQQLEASSGFADGLADAAGTNGPLAQTLRDADQAWTLRRIKLLEMLKSLVDSIEAVNQAFIDADADLADQIKPDAPTPAPTPTPTPVGDATTPSSGPTQPIPQPLPHPDSATGSSFPGPAVVGDASPAAPVAAQPAEEAAPMEPGGLPGWSVPPATTTAIPPKFEILIRDFASRWSALTGQSVDAVVALVVAGLGAGGVITVAAIATILAALQPNGGRHQGGAPFAGGPSSGGSIGKPPPGVDGSPAGSGQGQPSGESGESTGDAEAISGVDGEAAVEPTDGTDGDPQPLEDSADAADAAEAADHVAETPIVGDTAVSPTDLEALTPEAGGTATPELADLAPLPPLGEGGGGGSAGGAGSPVELPPLEPRANPASDAMAASGAPDALPALTKPTGFEVPAQMSDGAPLPDLTAVPAEEHERMAAAPMMGGLGAMAGAASGAHPAASPSTSSVGAERSGARQAARDVLNSHEGEEGR